MASLRDGIYYTRMRVPPRFRHVDDRKEIWVSLGTGDKRDAELEEIKTRAALVADWEARAGIGGTPEEQFRRAATIAASRGFTYRTAPELAAEQLDEILTRVEAVPAGANPQEIAAILGGVEKPRTMLSGLVAEVERLSEHDNRFKSDEQMRLWRSPRARAVANLRAALRASGRPDDPVVIDVSSDMARIHRRWWQKRIEREGLNPDTANKDYANLSGMLKRVFSDLDLDFPKPYGGVCNRDKFAEESRKPEFSDAWIREHIVAPGALDGLNDEAAAIILIALETGCRQSEIHNLPAEDICLSSNIPHIRIRHVESDDPRKRREVKNKHSVRLMPLVGVALEAARRHPNGFPRYRGSSGFSATVNKWFRERGEPGENGKRTSIFPTPKHTIGGLRHSWESRLAAMGLSNEIRAVMMGHSVGTVRGRPVYGDDLELHVKHIVAQLVGFGVIGSSAERAEMTRELDAALDKLKQMREG